MSTSFVSSDRFDDMEVSEATRRAIREVFGYERLSTQQSRYMSQMLNPSSPDVFVKAGTGSGKTLGFLIPSVEAIVRSRGKSERKSRSRIRSGVSGVAVLVLSPTRELATQTAGEATRLLTFHSGMKALAITGGTDRNKDVRVMRTSPPDILVATPGRLQDLLEEMPLLLRHVVVVVLDEADRLLDPGFAPAVRKILATLPSSSARRTLLLTATVPPEVQSVAKQFMRPGYEYVDASGGTSSKAARPANIGVKQVAILCKPTCIHVELARTLSTHHISQQATRTAKVLVFFSSIALAELYAALFRSHTNDAWAGLLELHGGLAQNKRTRAMEEFKSKPSGVLFASDAAGRGIDVPKVTMVVQVGCAPPDVYQQRVGRTGRAGAAGEAILLLGSDEVKSLGPIKAISPILEVRDAATVGEEEHKSFMIMERDKTLAERAFKGALGAYKANAKVLGWNSQQLVDAVAARVLGMGLNKVPEVNDKTLGKMGLKGVSFDTSEILKRMNVKSMKSSGKRVRSTLS